MPPDRVGLAALAMAGDDTRSLSTLIESEIIPRLVMAHAADARGHPRATAIEPITDTDVETLAELALQGEAADLLGRVEAIVARGSGVDTILVDLLAPAARLLGEYWESDRCDFLDVTMALWRLQEVVHDLATRVPPDQSVTAGGHRALFVTMPGDQHSFGTVVIDELFRREGWLTDRIGEAETSELLHRVAEEWFDLVGLTVGCDCHIGAVAPIIVALRNVSRNPHLCVMVGGRVFNADPELGILVGADGTARDAKLALTLASTLVRERETLACS